MERDEFVGAVLLRNAEQDAIRRGASDQLRLAAASTSMREMRRSEKLRRPAAMAWASRAASAGVARHQGVEFGHLVHGDELQDVGRAASRRRGAAAPRPAGRGRRRCLRSSRQRGWIDGLDEGVDADAFRRQRERRERDVGDARHRFEVGDDRRAVAVDAVVRAFAVRPAEEAAGDRGCRPSCRSPSRCATAASGEPARGARSASSASGAKARCCFNRWRKSS